MEQTKLVVIKTVGALSELGYITGPCLNPWHLPIEKIRQLVNGGKLVYERNPANPEEEIKLTPINYNKENFVVTAEDVAKITRVTTPVFRKDDAVLEEEEEEEDIVVEDKVAEEAIEIPKQNDFTNSQKHGKKDRR